MKFAVVPNFHENCQQNVLRRRFARHIAKLGYSMEIVGDKVEALTDFEVLDVVQSQLGRLGTRFQALASAGVDVAAELAKMKLLEHLWILQHVQQFLSALPCAHQDPQSLQNFLEGVVESFQDVLNKQEIAQLINIRPHNIVLLHAILPEFTTRTSEEQALKLIKLIQDTLPEPSFENDEEMEDLNE